MPECAVAACRNYRRKTKGQNVLYHRFPKKPDVLKVWVAKCKRVDRFPTENARVCSTHFSTDDYQRDLKSELLGLPPKKRLKDEAVPSQNLDGRLSIEPNNACLPLSPTAKINRGTTPNASLKSSVAKLPMQRVKSTRATPTKRKSREERCKSREIRVRALQRLATLSPKRDTCDKETATDPVDDELKKLRDENKRLQEQVKSCNLEKAMTLKQIVELKQVNQSLRKSVLNLKKENSHTVTAEVRKILRKTFTQNQITCFLKGQKSAHWDHVDIARALVLRDVSRRCYIYLRNKVGLPLPGLATLRRWTKGDSDSPPAMTCHDDPVSPPDVACDDELEVVSVKNAEQTNVYYVVNLE